MNRRALALASTVALLVFVAATLVACGTTDVPPYEPDGVDGGGVPDTTVRRDTAAGEDGGGQPVDVPEGVDVPVGADVPVGTDTPGADTGGPVVNPEGGPSWLVADRAEAALSAPEPRHAGPEDWRDEVVYFVLTDRFRNGDAANDETGFRDDGTALHDPGKPNRYHGGDFAGLREGIDYLRRLGVTAIWITPVVENVIEDAGRTGYAGYWAHDFAKVDPHLVSVADPTDVEAGRAAYADLVSDLHDAGLLVVQDIVVNHVGNVALYEIGGEEVWDPDFTAACYGTESHLFIDESSHADEEWVAYGLRTRPAAPFDDPAWYHNCGRAESGTKGDLYGLDDIATELPEVRQAFVEIYGGWVDDANVDGFRMDTVKNVEPDFWSAFSPAIRAVVDAQTPGRRFFQFGEAFDVTHGSSGPYVNVDRLDALLNFEFFHAVQDVFVGGQGSARLTAEIEGRDRLRAEPFGDGGAGIDAAAGALNFIENHDFSRFLDVSGADEHRLRAALMYLLTAKGVPVLYYNSENTVRGSNRTAEGGRVSLPDLETTGKLTFTLIRVFNQLRRDHVALRRGDMTVLADRDAPGLFAFARHTADPAETVVVVLNTSASAIEETVPLATLGADGGTDGQAWTNAVLAAFGAEEILTVEGGALTVALEPFDAKVLVR